MTETLTIFNLTWKNEKFNFITNLPKIVEEAIDNVDIDFGFNNALCFILQEYHDVPEEWADQLAEEIEEEADEEGLI